MRASWKGSAEKAEDQDDPMEGPPKKEESSSEELVPDDPGRAHKSATEAPRQFRAVTHVTPPPGDHGGLYRRVASYPWRGG